MVLDAFNPRTDYEVNELESSHTSLTNSDLVVFFVFNDGSCTLFFYLFLRLSQYFVRKYGIFMFIVCHEATRDLCSKTPIRTSLWSQGQNMGLLTTLY